MTASYNGFKAGDPSVFTPPGLDNSFVPGTSVQLAPGVHRGDIATVLHYVAAQLDARVEDGDPPPHDDWGYAFRPSKNDAALLSCHASGTAFDWNATRHRNGTPASASWTPAQITEIRKILAEVEGTVHWGGDGWGKGSTIDSMHFEIATGTTLEELAQVAKKLNLPRPKPAPKPATNWYHGSVGTRTLANGSRGDDVGNLQAILNSRYPLYSKLVADGIFGDRTEAVVREFQKRSKLAVDGIVGKKTFAALGL
jgi:hypothetical protein